MNSLDTVLRSYRSAGNITGLDVTLPDGSRITQRDAPPPVRVSPVWAVASVASSAAGAFHGYRRNQSVGWAIWWGFAGAVAPVIVPAIALAQGFGKPSKRVRAR